MLIEKCWLLSTSPQWRSEQYTALQSRFAAAKQSCLAGEYMLMACRQLAAAVGDGGSHFRLQANAPEALRAKFRT